MEDQSASLCFASARLASFFVSLKLPRNSVSPLIYDRNRTRYQRGTCGHYSSTAFLSVRLLIHANCSRCFPSNLLLDHAIDRRSFLHPRLYLTSISFPLFLHSLSFRFTRGSESKILFQEKRRFARVIIHPLSSNN